MNVKNCKVGKTKSFAVTINFAMALFAPRVRERNTQQAHDTA